MNVNLSKPVTFLVLGLMILAMPMSIFVSSEEENTGGTDGTVMFAEAGGSGEFAWNDIHNFVIEESGIKLEENFNVTICETVKEKAGEPTRPSGHIFGELTGIQWDDSPEPTFTISNEDFEEYREDENNLTVYAYGEYYDEDNAGEKDRYAYKTVTITKPNNPPTPVAWITEQGNWTWLNMSDESEATFVVSEGNEVTIWFNAEQSWDPDNEDIAEWRWDFDEDGSFGGPGEKGENLSKVLTTGKTYEFGLMVGDERGQFSETSLDFTINVISPELKSDLTVGEINYENKNKQKPNFEVTDVIIIQPKIRNEGDNSTASDSFKVLIEYSKDNGASWTQLTVMQITNEITSGNFELLTYNWDTGSFTKGQYKIRVTADYENAEDEEYEDNNVNETNLISLEDKSGTGTPSISIESVTPDKTTAKVNEPVNVTVSVLNSGDGDANYVDIQFDIGGEDQYFRTIGVVAAGSNATIIFPFTGDQEATFTLGFIAKDDGNQVGDKVTVNIKVERVTPVVVVDPNATIEGEEESTGFIPGFEALSLVGATAIGVLFISRKRRR
jgi:hypothetical protein